MRREATVQDSLGQTAWVNQATAMIAIQAGCTIDEADTKLRDRAAINGRLVKDLALDVVEHRIGFK
jgi:hypothetical protein